MKPLASAKPCKKEVTVSWDCRNKKPINPIVFIHTTVTSRQFYSNKKRNLLDFMGIVAKITLINVKEYCHRR